MKIQFNFKFFFLLNVVGTMYGTSIQQQSVSMFLDKYPQSTVIESVVDCVFNFNQFPLYKANSDIFFPSSGVFKPVFILKIPNGRVYYSGHDYSGLNYLFINDCFIKEMQIKHFNWFGANTFEIPDAPSNLRKIEGRVAVVSHHFPSCYGHWIFDILGQLAMLEMQHVEYDYLCIPYCSKFMKETLDLWGIDLSKIIPLTQGTLIQADQIIVCTPVTQIEQLVGPNANYNMNCILKYIQSKLLQPALDQCGEVIFAKKVFISRKKAASRVVPNEDAIFALFEAHGFQRYELTELSFAQQVALFFNADIVVSFVGSGSTNIMFCRPGTHYVEIIQNTVDATFFYEADIFNLKYSCIDNSTFDDLVHGHQMTPARELPLSLVELFLREL